VGTWANASTASNGTAIRNFMFSPFNARVKCSPAAAAFFMCPAMRDILVWASAKIDPDHADSRIHAFHMNLPASGDEKSKAPADS
jgi:hypothetical protein